MIDGEPTLYGWFSYLQSVAGFALHGLIGATVFYLVWTRWLGPNNSFNPKPLRGSAGVMRQIRRHLRFIQQSNQENTN